MRRHRSLMPTLLALTGALALGGTPVAAQAPDRIDLPPGFQPEGIAAHGTTIFVGSLADGSIWAGDVRTGEGDILVPGEEGAISVGMDHEDGANRLWVAGGATGQVRVFDSVSGEALGVWQFEAGFINDIVITDAGAFATDSQQPQVLHVPLGDDGTLPAEDGGRSIAISGDLEYVEGFNANGIVARDGWLLIVQSATGGLFRVDPASGTSFAIATGEEGVTGGDGLELHGDVLYAVRWGGDQVAALELGPLTDTAALIARLTSDDFDVPTTVAVADDQLWVVNARFGTDATAETEYWITRLPLRP